MKQRLLPALAVGIYVASLAGAGAVYMACGPARPEPTPDPCNYRDPRPTVTVESVVDVVDATTLTVLAISTDPVLAFILDPTVPYDIERGECGTAPARHIKDITYDKHPFSKPGDRIKCPVEASYVVSVPPVDCE